MTTYKGINGFAVQSVATDPSPLDEGQVWYNNASYAFKLATVTTAGTWAAGGNLNTARNTLNGEKIGIQTAALIAGGYNGAYLSITESYNGASWSPVSSMNNNRIYAGAVGTQTAGLIFSGEAGSSGSSLSNE